MWMMCNFLNLRGKLRSLGALIILVIGAEADLKAGPFDEDAPVAVPGVGKEGGAKTWRDSEFRSILEAADYAMPGEPQAQFLNDVVKKTPSKDGLGGFYDLLFLASVRSNSPGEAVAPRPGHSDTIFRRWGVDVLRTTGMMSLAWTWVEDDIRFRVEVRTSTSEAESEPHLARIADAMHAAPRPGRIPVSDGDSWKTAVGMGAAGAAAVAAAAKLLASIFNRGNGRKKSVKDKKNETGETVGYVLQLSTEEIDLSSGVPAPLTVTAWAVDSKGGYRPAPRASITVTPSGVAARYVSVKPDRGNGNLACQVATSGGAGTPTEAEGSLNVSVSAPGGKGAVAQVKLVCARSVTMEFF